MKKHNFSVNLSEIIKEFHLNVLNDIEGYQTIKVVNNEINRPSLQIAGFFDYFDNTRLQIIGMVETTYLQRMTSEKRIEALEGLFERKIPAIIISRGITPSKELIELATKYDTPVLQTNESTSRFVSGLIAYLNLMLAERVTMHGVLVEVYGEGILMLGDSGVGKSETAIELVKRGHRLVADDAVEVKKASNKTLVGSAPAIIRHFIELRGIGIVDVKRIFGMGAVKDTEKVDMVIHLEPWEEHKQYDRLGITTEYEDIMGIQVPTLTIPVKPGRNLAMIVEVAAMNNRQKRMGYNAAEALNNRLMNEMENGGTEL